MSNTDIRKGSAYIESDIKEINAYVRYPDGIIYTLKGSCQPVSCGKGKILFMSWSMLKFIMYRRYGG